MYDDDASQRSHPADQRVDDLMEVLLVVAPDPDVEPETGERVSRRLRSEIADLDVEWVRPGPSVPAPDGAKAADPVTLGAIMVAMSASGGVFATLIETVRDWLGRSSARHRVSLTINGDTIELERASNAERRDLIDAYIRRHAGG
ncbi:hypothetical protein [Streptomyces shaanxiensis]